MKPPRFFEQIADHNDKAWFEQHKEEYEDCVRTPALEVIRAMAPLLADFAPAFRAAAPFMRFLCEAAGVRY